MRGKVAVVTGAASGIGRELATGLAQRGARLSVSDLDEVGLAETARRCEEFGAQCHARRLDVSDRDAFTAYADEVAGHYGTVHQIYNNAGVFGSGRTILDSDRADFEKVLGVNLWGVVHGTRAFLPHLIASGDGHVVNLSSLNGFMAQPLLGPYCTAKFGVRGFTETLRTEMLAGGHPVRVTVVHPGGVKTNIATAALTRARSAGREVTDADRTRARTYNEKLLKMPADKAARTILDGVEAGRSRVLVGNDAKALDLMVRTVPRFYTDLVAKFAPKLFRR